MCWFLLHVFKQPLVDLGDQSTIREEGSIALLGINVQRAQSSFMSETDVVDQLLICSFKCRISLANQEFLLLDMLVVHPFALACYNR